MTSRVFIERPIFASVLSIVIVLVGLLALQNLPIAQFPPITPPTVQIEADYPGATAEVVATYAVQIAALVVVAYALSHAWRARGVPHVSVKRNTTDGSATRALTSCAPCTTGVIPVGCGPPRSSGSDRRSLGGPFTTPSRCAPGSRRRSGCPIR